MNQKRKNLKRITKNIIESLKFKLFSLSFSKQIILVGNIIGIISLFLSWIIIEKKEINSWNAFNAISGNIGYILLILFLILVFLIFSKNYKENLKLYSEIDLKNHFIIIFSGLFTIIISIICISFTVGILNIWQDVKYGQGPIFCIISGILLLVGGLMDRANFKKVSSEIILEHLEQNRQKNKEKDNMKLPF